jgi:hypothetical protein
LPEVLGSHEGAVLAQRKLRGLSRWDSLALRRWLRIRNRNSIEARSEVILFGAKDLNGGLASGEWLPSVEASGA